MAGDTLAQAEKPWLMPRQQRTEGVPVAFLACAQQSQIVGRRWAFGPRRCVRP
jgi:hypothetical protein